MIELDQARTKTKSFKHQTIGTAKLLTHPAFCLFDEMGAGKSKQVIDAACFLFEAREIDSVVVVAPASVKSVWYDSDIGEIRKHCFLPTRVFEIRGSVKNNPNQVRWSDQPIGTALSFYIVSYEWLRASENVDWFIRALSSNRHKVMLVCDESSFLKNRTAEQTKAVMRLSWSESIARRVLLNGTPVTQTPLDLFSQMKVVSDQCLSRFRNWYQFRARFAVMGGFQGKQVVKYQNLEELQRLVAPYAIRRLKKDCLDLPPKLFTQREVALSEATWKIYKQLRDESLVELPDDDVRVEANAAVRIMRLLQLTSGLLGGDFTLDETNPDEPVIERLPPKEISNEKQCWAVEYITNETQARALIVWCRWRRERELLAKALANEKVLVYEYYGGQSKTERTATELTFDRPWADQTQKLVLLAQPQAGGRGRNFTAATEVVYLSQSHSLEQRLQTEDRVHRPGQTRPVTYVDVIATGPQGQRTIDHAVVKALRDHQELARWTCAAWRRALEEE